MLTDYPRQTAGTGPLSTSDPLYEGFYAKATKRTLSPDENKVETRGNQ